MLNVLNYQTNANKNSNEVSSYPSFPHSDGDMNDLLCVHFVFICDLSVVAGFLPLFCVCVV